MWAVLWCGWRRGYQTRISKELDFSWGSSGIFEWDRCKIMHNAGVLAEDKGSKFYKGDYIVKTPFEADLSFVEQTSNTWNYVQAIEYAKKQREIL